MSASTTRQVRHKIPLPLSIAARPHEAGPILSWRADSLALVWLDSGITPCCKSRKSNNPKNLAKVDLWASLRLRRSLAPLRRSVIDFGGNYGVPHVGARTTHQRL